MRTREHGLIVTDLPFSAGRAYPRVMPDAHVHTDIELNLLLSGWARYFLAGRFHDLAPGRLAAFWAGTPHRLIAVGPGTEYLCMTLPLGWFLAWDIGGGGLRDRLLGGELIVAEEQSGADDAARFGAWARDLSRAGRDDPEARRIVLLEVEARLRRLAREVAPRPPRGGGEGERGEKAGAGYVEAMAGLIGRRYREPLTVEEIAAAAGLHPRYALAVFKQGCGLTPGEYLTRLRVSHAQRLLLTTDWTVERVAAESGFGSPSRFFATFRRRCGCTPRAYRLRG